MSQLTKEEIHHHREVLKNRRENALRNKALGESIQRLINNPDFIEVIQKGFCGSEMQAYVCNSVDLNCNAAEREDALEMAKAAGRLSVWLSVKLQMTNTSHKELMECDEQEEYINEMDQ